MCMEPIHSVDALFRHVLDVIQASTASHIGECGVEGRTQVNRRNGFATHAFFEDVEVCGGMLMNDSLCEIHIKICPALIVMYSQRHVC